MSFQSNPTVLNMAAGKSAGLVKHCNTLLNTLSFKTDWYNKNGLFTFSLDKWKKNGWMDAYSFTRGCHSSSSAYLTWQIFTLDALPNAALEGFVSPPGVQPEIFCLLGECVNHYTLKNGIFTVYL